MVLEKYIEALDHGIVKILSNDGSDFWCEYADKHACFVIFVRSGEDIYYARRFPKWAMKRPIMQ